MRYKIYKKDDSHYKLRRKVFLFWVWLDATKAWCNWYGKEKPHIFNSIDEVENFIRIEKDNTAKRIMKSEEDDWKEVPGEYLLIRKLRK